MFYHNGAVTPLKPGDVIELDLVRYWYCIAREDSYLSIGSPGDGGNQSTLPVGICDEIGATAFAAALANAVGCRAESSPVENRRMRVALRPSTP